MGLFLQHKTAGMQRAVWKMEESLDIPFSLLPGVRRVSCEREMWRFTSDRRKLEWLFVRVLLYSMSQGDKEIGYSSEGKPHLTDNSSFTSISHTKGYVVVILSSVAPVSIGIEQYGQRVRGIYDRFTRSDERVEPYQGDEIWSILLHWLAKETILKSMENVDADLRKLCSSYFIPQSEGVFQVREYTTGRQQLFTVSYRICPDFVLTWTVTI